MNLWNLRPEVETEHPILATAWYVIETLLVLIIVLVVCGAGCLAAWKLGTA